MYTIFGNSKKLELYGCFSAEHVGLHGKFSRAIQRS